MKFAVIWYERIQKWSMVQKNRQMVFFFKIFHYIHYKYLICHQRRHKSNSRYMYTHFQVPFRGKFHPWTYRAVRQSPAFFIPAQTRHLPQTLHQVSFFFSRMQQVLNIYKKWFKFSQFTKIKSFLRYIQRFVYNIIMFSADPKFKSKQMIQMLFMSFWNTFFFRCGI